MLDLTVALEKGFDLQSFRTRACQAHPAYKHCTRSPVAAAAPGPRPPDRHSVLSSPRSTRRSTRRAPPPRSPRTHRSTPLPQPRQSLRRSHRRVHRKVRLRRVEAASEQELDVDRARGVVARPLRAPDHECVVRSAGVEQLDTAELHHLGVALALATSLARCPLRQQDPAFATNGRLSPLPEVTVPGIGTSANLTAGSRRWSPVSTGVPGLTRSWGASSGMDVADQYRPSSLGGDDAPSPLGARSTGADYRPTAEIICSGASQRVRGSLLSASSCLGRSLVDRSMRVGSDRRHDRWPANSRPAREAITDALGSDLRTVRSAAGLPHS